MTTTSTNCVDLKERFGRRYRVAYEESYAAERGERGWANDPWLQIIACQNGHIYPHGGELLGASTNRRGRIPNRLAALSCVRVVQDGDDGVNAVFHVDDFAKVAAIMKPKIRRKLSPEQRERLLAAGAQSRFVSKHGADDAHGDRRRDARPTADSQAV